MKVKVAKTAGFCFGVKRAVDKVYQLIEQGVQPIYTLGPIIHNEEVVSDLADRGVQVIEEQDLDTLSGGTVVIRSHGVGREVYHKLETNHLDYVDVTCPFVLNRDTPHCRKAEPGRKTHRYFRRSGSPRSQGNLRLVRGRIHRSEKQRGHRAVSSTGRQRNLCCFTDDI